MSFVDAGPSARNPITDADSVVSQSCPKSLNPSGGYPLDSPSQPTTPLTGLSFQPSIWGPDGSAGAGSPAGSTHSAIPADSVAIVPVSGSSPPQALLLPLPMPPPRVESWLAGIPTKFTSPVAGSASRSIVNAGAVDTVSIDSTSDASLFSRIPPLPSCAPFSHLESWLAGLPNKSGYFSAGAGSLVESTFSADSCAIYPDSNSPKGPTTPSRPRPSSATASQVKDTFTDVDSCAIYSSDSRSYRAPILPRSSFVNDIYWTLSGVGSPIGSISSSVDSIAVYSSDSWSIRAAILPPSRITDGKRFASRAYGFISPPSTVAGDQQLTAAVYSPSEAIDSVSTNPHVASWETFSSAYPERIPPTPRGPASSIPITTGEYLFHFSPTPPSDTSISRVYRHAREVDVYGPFPPRITKAIERIDLGTPLAIPYSGLLSVLSRIDSDPSANDIDAATTRAIREVVAHCDILVDIDRLQQDTARAIVDALKLVGDLEKVMPTRLDGGKRTDDLAVLVEEIWRDIALVQSHHDYQRAMKVPDSLPDKPELLVKQRSEVALLASKWRVFVFVLEKLQDMWNFPDLHGVDNRVVACGAGPKVEVGNQGRELLHLILEHTWKQALCGSEVFVVEPPVVVEEGLGKEKKGKKGVWSRVFGAMETVGRYIIKKWRM